MEKTVEIEVIEKVLMLYGFDASARFLFHTAFVLPPSFYRSIR